MHDTSIITSPGEDDEEEEGDDIEEVERANNTVDKITLAPSYQTLTEGFFMTHYCLRIGLNVLLGEYFRTF